MKTLLLLALAGIAPLVAESDFDRTVSQLERHFDTQRLHIPFLGLVTGLTSFARPMGVKDFKLAIFENIDTGRAKVRFPGADLGDGWRPIVRVSSLKEHVEVLARDEEQWVRLLVVTLDHRDATVVQMSVKPNKVWELIGDKVRNR